VTSPDIHLSATPAARDWAHFSTTDFTGDLAELVILPLYGLADHRLGLGWRAEEVIGSTLLAQSLTAFPEDAPIRVLPPLRLSLAPYHAALAPASATELKAAMERIAGGVKFAGAKRLAFWSTCPWNSEVVDVASRDIRIERDLATFVIELSGLGLSLHPRSQSRATLRKMVSDCVGREPEEVPPTDPPEDSAFRPGNWSHYPPVDETIDPPPEKTAGQDAAGRLASLWQEILLRPVAGPFPIDLPFSAPRRQSAVVPYPAIPPENDLGLLGPIATAEAARRDLLVIIPIGAIEQHGAHLPVGVDAMIAEAGAKGLAERLPDRVLVAPTIAYGKSNEHHDYAGTIDLGADLVESLLKRQVTSLAHLGFRQFAVLNTHGGNSSVLVYTLRELQTSLGVRIGMLRIPLTDELSAQESTWGFHAGEWETSVMLAIAPEAVHMDKAICHYPSSIDDPGELRPENAPAVFSWKTRDIAEAGVMGDATQATAAKGKRWWAAALDELAESIRQLT